MLSSGEFVVNIVTEADIERMDHTSAALPEDESEFDLVDIERGESRTVFSAARVADAAVSMECRLHDSIEVHDKLMILGDVQYVHVDDDLLTDGQIDMRDLDTVGRLGRPYYTVSGPLAFERQY